MLKENHEEDHYLKFETYSINYKQKHVISCLSAYFHWRTLLKNIVEICFTPYTTFEILWSQLKTKKYFYETIIMYLGELLKGLSITSQSRKKLSSHLCSQQWMNFESMKRAHIEMLTISNAKWHSIKYDMNINNPPILHSSSTPCRIQE